MADTTERLMLPLLHAGQAQKELTHNEALAVLDIAVTAAVSGVRDAPPIAPVSGEAWIVGIAPTGEWAGQAGAIAGWTAGGWRFVPATEGLAAWLVPERVTLRREGHMWQRGVVRGDRLAIGGIQVVGAQAAAIPAPAGGAAIDTEGRAAISQILTALRGHGLIAG